MKRSALNDSLPRAVFDAGSFADRVVLVTGGAHGIGRATVQLLASLGARVVTLDLNQERLDTLAAEPVEGAGEVVVMHGDVCKQPDLKAMVATARERWGRIDGIVNNALSAEHGPIETRTAAQITKVWETNTLAAWRLTKLALPLLEVAGGSVVNLSSIMAFRPGWPAAAYASSKAGLEGLTRALAVELGARRIRVNAIAPGPISTRTRRQRENPGVPEEVWTDYWATLSEMRHVNQLSQHPLPDVGLPIDVANTIAFLLSEGGRFINGALIRVDGGAFCYDGVQANSDRHAQLAALREKLAAYQAKWPAIERSRRRKK